ncbi:MBL fold metallo-hydrolase [Paenibacillus daejeonensis]|uniref:MBL fold metallo-hydrolase n=1 Tax=Paenibacillus daejeonensis TaxID=135193 RepID=UPI000371173D|nr:MBL fold metallo-hydrolase [Paenibacillus daejeonensis]
MSVPRSRQTVREWLDGWIQVKVPLPFALRWVNSYLIPDQRGYTLVDPGLHTPEAVQIWETVTAERGIAYSSIHTIVLTHQHPDHYGLAGWWQQRSGAPVRMSAAARAYTSELWGEHPAFPERLLALYAQHGMPQHQLNGIREHLDRFVALVSPQPQLVELLEAGEPLTLGDLSWDVLDAPGHAAGHLCFYQREQKLMICGDQVLPDITPNISLVPGGDDDPLASFLSSLEELSRFPVEQAFPGHRDPFSDFAGRIAEIRSHHEQRLTVIADELEQPRDGYEICQQLFGARVGTDSHNLRFAMAETLAHLRHLVRLGRVQEQEVPGAPARLHYARMVQA